MWRTVLIYAGLLVVAALGLQWIEMFPIGIVISLISAALLRNSRFLPARAAP